MLTQEMCQIILNKIDSSYKDLGRKIDSNNAKLASISANIKADLAQSFNDLSNKIDSSYNDLRVDLCSKLDSFSNDIKADIVQQNAKIDSLGSDLTNKIESTNADLPNKIDSDYNNNNFRADLAQQSQSCNNEFEQVVGNSTGLRLGVNESLTESIQDVEIIKSNLKIEINEESIKVVDLKNDYKQLVNKSHQKIESIIGKKCNVNLNRLITNKVKLRYDDLYKRLVLSKQNVDVLCYAPKRIQGVNLF